MVAGDCPGLPPQTSLTGHLGKASESSCRELLLTLTFRGKFFSGIGYCNSFKSWANLCFGSHDRKVTSISKAVRKTWGIQGLPECKCKTSVLWGCLHCSCCLVQVCLWNCGRFQVLDCVVEAWGSNPHLRWLPSCLGKNRVSSSKLSSVAPLLLHSAPSVLSTESEIFIFSLHEESLRAQVYQNTVNLNFGTLHWDIWKWREEKVWAEEFGLIIDTPLCGRQGSAGPLILDEPTWQKLKCERN